jgi:hypothetical protein
MAYLIIRLQGAEDERMSEEERPEPILRLNKRCKITGYVDWEAAREMLVKHGYELASPLGRHPMTEWPFTAVCYVSKRKDGYGRSGSQLYRWAVRRKDNG